MASDPQNPSPDARRKYAAAALARQRRAHVDVDHHGAIVREVETRLFEHIEPVRLAPTRAVSLGADSRQFQRALGAQFANTRWLQLASCIGYLRPARRRWPWRRAPAAIAWPHQLPVADASIGLVVSNLTSSDPLHLPDALGEYARCLEPDGLVALSLLGPATFGEFAHAWRTIDSGPHTAPFLDMHDVGDILVNQGFSGVVMDSEMLTVTYASVADAIIELRGLGIGNHLLCRRNGLVSRGAWRRAAEAYPQADGRVPVTVELVYAHAWRQSPRNSASVNLEIT